MVTILATVAVILPWLQHCCHGYCTVAMVTVICQGFFTVAIATQGCSQEKIIERWMLTAECTVVSHQPSRDHCP